MNKLNNKVVVVTGASSGIGRGIALACAREGADVVINYRQSADKAEAVAAEIQAMGRQALAMQADMSDSGSIKELIARSREKFTKIDIWINNAGADILTGAGADAEMHEKLEQLIEVDLKGTIKACWIVARVFEEQGHGVFVNMSWDLAVHGFEGSNPQIFAATKAGVIGFTRSFAKSVGPFIRANVISPGWIATAFVEDHMQDEYYQARISEIPLGRFGKPDDVAAAVLFLASDESSYMTGEAIKVNGGLI